MVVQLELVVPFLNFMFNKLIEGDENGVKGESAEVVDGEGPVEGEEALLPDGLAQYFPIANIHQLGPLLHSFSWCHKDFMHNRALQPY